MTVIHASAQSVGNRDSPPRVRACDGKPLRDDMGFYVEDRLRLTLEQSDWRPTCPVCLVLLDAALERGW